MGALLPIRKVSTDGALGLRDGIVFVLFMRNPHVELCDSIAQMYEGFEKLVGAEQLQWVHDRGESYRPYTVRRRARIRELLSPVTAEALQEERFTIKGGCGESDAGGFLFGYRGRSLTGKLASVNASSVEMWFPTEFGESLGWDRFAAALLELANKVPFSSGYCSLGFNREDWAVVGTEEFVAAQATRHPGMDIHQTTNTALRIGDDVRGAYWLTLLSAPGLARLGLSVESLREQLGSGIEVTSMQNGVAIQAGAAPDPGDRNRKESLPLIRKVAALIEPIQHIQTVGIFGFLEVEDFANWQRRHLL